MCGRRQLMFHLWATATAAPGRRPNILLVVADDVGYTDLGAYGGEIRTPVIARLAAGGVRILPRPEADGFTIHALRRME